MEKWFLAYPNCSYLFGCIRSNALAGCGYRCSCSIIAQSVCLGNESPTLARLFGRFKTTPSQFKTQFLVVTINFANSKIDGEIISGDFTGNKLSELSQDQLKDLLQQYKVSDKESYILLQAYLIRSGSSTDQSNEQFKPNSFNGLSNDEAFDILGIPKTASKDEILKAHKRLMQRMHPDRGGSDYLAAKINAAKDQLIK